MRRLLAASVLLALAVPGAASGATVTRGIAFGQAPDERGRPETLRLDLYRPAGPAPPGGRPAVVWIHGGGFTRGTRAWAAPYAERFAERGHVAASIDYRLWPHHDLAAPGRPAPVHAAQHDAQAAVRWLRRHAGRLRVDPSRIHAAGTSAGGITALNVALHPGDPGHSGSSGYSSAVAAAVAVAGFAPVRAIGSDAPPLLLLHGTADRTIALGRAERTCRAAEGAGVTCDLVTFPDAGHGMIRRRAAELADRAATWIEHLSAR